MPRKKKGTGDRGQGTGKRKKTAKKKGTGDRGQGTGKRKPAVEYPWIREAIRHLAVPIDQIEVDPGNAKTHDEQNIRAVMMSLRQTGQYHPLIVNGNNRQVVIGNCRLVAARRLGWTHVAVNAWPMTPAEQARLSPVDNLTGEMGEWDGLLLQASLETVEESNADLADLLRLQLAIDDVDKRRGKKEPELDASPQLAGLEYRIIVVCEGEDDQAELLAELEGRGLTCQALIS